MKGVLYLSKAAQMKCFPQLKRLFLSENRIGSQINKYFFQKQEQEEGLIVKFTNLNTKLQELELRGNKINDYDTKIFFKANQKNKKIFHYLSNLSLRGNKIKDEGIKALCRINYLISIIKIFTSLTQSNKQNRNQTISILQKQELIQEPQSTLSISKYFNKRLRNSLILQRSTIRSISIIINIRYRKNQFKRLRN